MATSMPQINPTGQNFFQGTGGPGNYNFGNSGNPTPVGTAMPSFNPTDAGMFAPTTSMTPGQGTDTNINPFGLIGGNAGQYYGQAAGFGNELGKIYSQGVGSELYDFLQSGGGYNSNLTQQAVNSQIAAMQTQIQRGYGNLQSSLGQAGISPNSSTAALETGDYMSQAVAQENAITGQEYFNMWNQSMQNETGILGDILGYSAQHKASQPTLMDYLGFGAQIGGSVAQGLQGGGGIGDVISSLAGMVV